MSEVTVRVFHLRVDNMVEFLFESPVTEFTDDLVSVTRTRFGGNVYTVEADFDGVEPVGVSPGNVRQVAYDAHPNTNFWQGNGQLVFHAWLLQVRLEAPAGATVRCATHGDSYAALFPVETGSQFYSFVNGWLTDEQTCASARKVSAVNVEVMRVTDTGFTVVCGVCGESWVLGHVCDTVTYDSEPDEFVGEFTADELRVTLLPSVEQARSQGDTVVCGVCGVSYGDSHAHKMGGVTS